MAARRNLTDDQRAMNAAALAEDEVRLAKRERAAKGTPAREARKHGTLADASVAKVEEANTRTPRSTEKAAKRSRVSERKVRQAQAVRKKAPKLAEQVLAGDLTLAAAVREVNRDELKAKLAEVEQPGGGDPRPKMIARRPTCPPSSLNPKAERPDLPRRPPSGPG